MAIFLTGCCALLLTVGKRSISNGRCEARTLVRRVLSCSPQRLAPGGGGFGEGYGGRSSFVAALERGTSPPPPRRTRHLGVARPANPRDTRAWFLHPSIRGLGLKGYAVVLLLAWS